MDLLMNLEFWFAVVVALLAVSEVLAYIPSVESNSVFQACVGFLKKIKGMFSK